MTKVNERGILVAACKGEDADGYGSASTRNIEGGVGMACGRMPWALDEIVNERRHEILQVIYSYGTPIAWLDAGAWIVPKVRYSVTTSKIQYKARATLPAVIEIPSDCTLEEYLAVLNGRKIRVSI